MKGKHGKTAAPAYRTLLLRRFLALALAVVTGVTFIPLMAGPASAASEAPDSIASEAPDIPGSDVIVTDADDIDLGQIDPEELTDEGLDIRGLDGTDGSASGNAEDEALPREAPLVGEATESAAAAAGITEGGQPLREADLLDAMGVPSLKKGAGAEPQADPARKGLPSDAKGSIRLTPNYPAGKVTVTGSVTGDSFQRIAVFDSELNPQTDAAGNTMMWDLSGAAFTREIDLRSLASGVYVIAVATANDTLYTDHAVAVNYGTPVNKPSQYETYSKYLFYKTASTHDPSDYSSELYMDIKKKGTKTWKTYGPLSSESQIKSLKPNKTYQARTYYRKTVSLQWKDTDGKIYTKSFLVSGRDAGRYKTVTIKTGKKKLPIKSVSVKAVNVKKHVHLIPGTYVPYRGKETWYTYRLKVTVKMKKKPGVKGIYINGKKVKGNKKTYTVKFGKVNSIFTGKLVVKPFRKYFKHTIAKIPRGSKYTVMLYSYSNKTYKAYSPMQKRTPRLR